MEDDPAAAYEVRGLRRLKIAEESRSSILPIMVTLDHSPVHSDPEILGGTLVFQGTRVPAQALLNYLTDGFTIKEFVEFFPSVEIADAEEFLKLAHAG